MSTPPSAGTDDEPVDDRIALVSSVGPLDGVVALLHELLHAASAIRATAIVPPEADEPPAVIDVARLAPIEVARGEHVVHLPHAGPLDVAVPPLFAFKQLPIFDADPETGDIAAPLGGVEHRAIGVAETAAQLPEGTVLQLAWDTTRAGVAFSVTARARDAGEPIVLGIGDEAFPMPAGWPDAPTLA
ncbi:hypothetical protein AB0L40_19975 [Patulibacter sp. NPDC049589]|uniref:hypothetical protein n=1 Tax=Patulibacter sp. NPDC049589 TaxID=3154731 RepID=UPI00342DD458